MPSKSKQKLSLLPVVFAKKLLHWHTHTNTRLMPWKGEKDPYKIWLSEIILQQTRVEQGLAYYERFVKTYPTILHLAQAKDEAIMKLWEGLGYYSRCRNLIATARFIATEKKGIFPNSYDDIKALKGIGPYTAAAIASFAYNLPHAVVDGNVFRVLARVFGIDTPIDSTAGKKEFTALAENLLDKKQAASYNQAIMDFGAVVCKPVSPNCGDCVFRKSCVAFINNTIETLPVKSKKIKIKNRWFYYLLLTYKNTIALRRRESKDIWQGLYEFPLIETDKSLTDKKIIKQAISIGCINEDAYQLKSVSPVYKQQLSHQKIEGQFFELVIDKKNSELKDVEWIPLSQLKNYAFPQFINQYLRDRKT